MRLCDQMRVAYLLAVFPSITEGFALREIQALQKLGIDIDVLAAQADPRLDDSSGVTIHYRPARVSWASLLSITKMIVFRPLCFMRLLLIALKLLFVSPTESLSLLANIHTVCDFALYLDDNNIKHFHAYFLSWPSLVTLGVKAMSDITISVSAHSRDIYVEAGDIERKIHSAEFVTVCTKTGIEFIKTQVPQFLHHKLLLSYHGLDLGDVSSCQAKSDSFEIVAVGRLVPKKGFLVLLEAFEKIHRLYPDVTLKIIGSGNLYSQILQRLKASQLEESVSLMGWLDHDGVMEVISRASLMVVPSVKTEDGDMDGIPNVILEAFSLMTPVIASDIKPICEVIEHGVNGFLFKTGDSNDLIEKIEELYKSGSLRNGIAKSAKEVLVNDFNIDTNVINKMKLFKQCL